MIRTREDLHTSFGYKGEPEPLRQLFRYYIYYKICMHVIGLGNWSLEKKNPYLAYGSF